MLKQIYLSPNAELNFNFMGFIGSKIVQKPIKYEYINL